MDREPRAIVLLLAGLFAGLALFLSVSLISARAAAAIACNVPSASHPTIQSAADDTACERIDVAAGNFAENVVISRSLAIHGQGITATVIDGSAAGAVFTIYPSNIVTMTSLTISNGLAISGGGIFLDRDNLLYLAAIQVSDNHASNGGGIFSTNARLVITNSVLVDNTAHDFNGYGGAIWSLGGRASVFNSLLEKNSAAGGGAIYSVGGAWQIDGSSFLWNYAGGGGAIVNIGENNLGTMRISNSIFSGNAVYVWWFFPWSHTGCGGAIANVDGGSVEVSSSSFSSNYVEDSRYYDKSGGAICTIGGDGWIRDSSFFGNIAGDGGAISAAYGATILLENSTVSLNTAVGLDGIGGGIAVSFAEITVSSTTIFNNAASYLSGGIFGYYGTVYLVNTIVAGNANSDCFEFLGNPPTSLGHNLDSDGSCNLTGPGDLPNTDPWLLPLGDYGGPTLTHSMHAVSPAIDAGDDAACPATDQRGVSRPLDGDGDGNPHCDIGAVEYDGPPASHRYLPLVFMPV
jgi:hypothetical protein